MLLQPVMQGGTAAADEQRERTPWADTRWVDTPWPVTAAVVFPDVGLPADAALGQATAVVTDVTDTMETMDTGTMDAATTTPELPSSAA
jgi:hypothetical protein